MAPYPEEIDVFSAPHSRMKALVDVYSEKLRCTDLSDLPSLDSLLCELHSTFREFKSHEQIENEHIVRELKTRLKVLEMDDSFVCDCHSDNKLSEMLSLVEAGRRTKDALEYGGRLRRALDDFTHSFLPHMREEEEVFQPLLVKCFGYEELVLLKERVIEEHLRWKKSEQEDADKKVDACGGDDYEAELSRLPTEVLRHVFSFLPKRDLVRCSAVCHQWNDAARDPALWTEIYPAFWAHGVWDDYCEDSHSERVSLFYPHSLPPPIRDEDADEDDDEPLHQEEALALEGVRRGLLPHVGPGVGKLVIASSRALDSAMLRSILMLCPNLTHLNVSYTPILDAAFKGVRLVRLVHLDLSGCSRVTDEGLYRIGEAMTSLEIEDTTLQGCCDACAVCRPPSLQHLDLSGCTEITDTGLRCLLEAGLLFRLSSLDVSGCWRLSGNGLCLLCTSAPFLSPPCISYCDRITDGPHPASANGCQNLETGERACCRNN